MKKTSCRKYGFRVRYASLLLITVLPIQALAAKFLFQRSAGVESAEPALQPAAQPAPPAQTPRLVETTVNGSKMSFYMNNTSETKRPPLRIQRAEPAAPEADAEAPRLVDATIPGTDKQMTFFMGSSTSAPALPDGLTRGTMPDDDMQTMTLLARSTGTEAGLACPGGCATGQNQPAISQLIFTHSTRPARKPAPEVIVRNFVTNSRGWVSPVAERYCRVSQERTFGVKPHPYKKDKNGRPAMLPHNGIDIQRNLNESTMERQSLVAPFPGRIVFRGWKSGYGNVLEIRSNDGRFVVRYAHLRSFGNAARVGARVDRGQFVARVGNTGGSRGAHLHFEIRKDGVLQNPLKYYTRAQLCR